MTNDNAQAAAVLSQLFSGWIAARGAGIRAPGQSAERMKNMNRKTESTVAIVAALLVLFSAMWDPRISAGLAVVALLGLGLYGLLRK